MQTAPRASRKTRPAPVRHQGRVVFQHRLDSSVLCVSVPAWVRPNIYITAPDEPAHHPLAEALILAGYLERLDERR